MRIVNEPFRHAVIDNLWPTSLLRDVLGEFPSLNDSRLRRFKNDHEEKLAGAEDTWGPRTHELFAQLSSLADPLGRAFSIEGLKMLTIGGGYHCIEPGGFLDIHTDFSVAGKLYRRLNLLVYLNDDWQDEGGRLELWGADGPSVSIAPEFNRTVIFETSSTSWHGHPIPAARIRRSIAAYFFTEEKPAGYTKQSTVFHPASRRGS